MIKNYLASCSKELYDYLATSSNFGIVQLDSNLVILDSNIGFLRLFSTRQNPVGEVLTGYIELDSNAPKCGEELRLPLRGKDGVIHGQFIKNETGYMFFCERLVLTESLVIEQLGFMNDESINIQRELIKKNSLLQKQSHELRTVNTQLQKSEERFRTLANSVPVLIWIAGLDKICIWFNKVWLDFTGRTLEQELGNGWTEGIHPDDYDRCRETFVSSFENRQPFAMEYRLRSADGQYRWLLDNGVPEYVNSTFTGYIGSCIDITEQKLAENNIQRLTRLYVAMSKCGQAIVQSKNEDELHQEICKISVLIGGNAD